MKLLRRIKDIIVFTSALLILFVLAVAVFIAHGWDGIEGMIDVVMNDPENCS